MLPSTSASDGPSRFPKLKECAHFHYDVVDLGAIQLSLDEENHDFHDPSATPRTSAPRSTDSGAPASACASSQQQTQRERSWRPLEDEPTPPTSRFYIRVSSREKAWVVRQSFEGFCNLDRQLHRCIYDRKYSLLPEIELNDISGKSTQDQRKLLSIYLKRFSTIACNMINCGPILTWMEMDNRGNHLVATDNGTINVPALAAGHVIKRYAAQSLDELSLEVGDIVSIIDMPPAKESTWWQGKCKFQVGFFPSECIQVISGNVPESMANKLPPKPVLRKRGKLISFLRSFFSSRPTRAQLKQTGIVKERVFGCDLGEHLLNSGHDVPLVLQVCASAIESHGVVDGIYRLSGVASNIQKLRNAFDEDRVPELTEDLFVQDVHCISSLLKMYFRELPNPLFTYLLYDLFALAMEDEDQRLTKIYDVVQQLPPPHYRTASYLMRHLCRLASHSSKTNMHCKNLAIVWAPNLFRSKELEQIQCSTAALSGVGIQAIITEFLIMYADVIFAEGAGNSGVSTMRHRPKSLMPLPSKLLSLEEAQERALLKSPRQKYIDVGGGPTALPHDYHTVVDLPKGKKPRKERKASLSNLKAIFSRSRSGSYRSSGSERGSLNDPQFQVRSYPPLVKPRNSVATIAEAAERRRHLRTAKSVDTLFYGGVLRGVPAAQFIQDGGHTIANPYAEDHWSYMTQGSGGGGIGGAQGGRPRTKSCNSSLSDSSDLDERCTTFIKPLQSSPQNSLKRRARHSDIPSGIKAPSFFSQRQLEHFGRSHGKENCDVFRSIAHGASSQPKISLSSRFNIPPEVPKRSTSLYIDSYEKNTPPGRPDSFLVVSKSLATVDGCRNGSPTTLPVPPPRSCSPRYSSSPSQSDHSDEVFNCGSAPIESEHPLTPICELLNASARTWESASYDTPEKFSLWMDSLYEERASERPDPRGSLCRSSMGDAPHVGSYGSGVETFDSGKGSGEQRWEVPTLVSGSAFVTDVNEYLAPDDAYVSREALMSQLGSMGFAYPASGESGMMRPSNSRPDSFAGEEVTLTLGSPIGLLDCGSEPENDVTPTEERLRCLDEPEREGFTVEGGEDGKCLRVSEMVGEDYDVGWANYFSREEAMRFDGSGDVCGKDVGGNGGDAELLESNRGDVDCFTGDGGLMESLERLIQSEERVVHGISEEQDLVRDEPMHESMAMEVGDNFPGKKSAGVYSRSVSDTSGVERRTDTSDSVSKPRAKSAPDAAESFDSDDHIGDEESWSAGFQEGLPLFPESDSFVEQIRKLQAASNFDYRRSGVEPESFVEVEKVIPSHESESLEISDSLLRESEDVVDDLEEVCRDVGSGEGATAFQVVATSIAATSGEAPGEFDALGEDDQHRSWVCVAMTGFPNPEKFSGVATPATDVLENDPFGVQTHDSKLPDCFSSSSARDEVSANKRDVEVDDATSWKTSLSLASCFRQLCADGYVADRSNSCSPVLADRSDLSQTLHHESPYDNLSVKSETGACDVPEDIVTNECIPEPVALRSNSVPSEYGEAPTGDAPGENTGMGTTSEIPGVPEDVEWSVSGHRVLCSSESDVFGSSVEVARYSSPVRRKSVRELKNRFESTADEGGVPVRAIAKKRPPVAKKPSIVRSAVMSKSLPRCDTSLDAGSDRERASGAESAPDSMSWSQGCSGASANLEGFSSYPVEAATRRSFEAIRPSSAGSTASCEGYPIESQDVGVRPPYRKPRCHSLHAASVSEVMGLSFAAVDNDDNGGVDLRNIGYLTEPLSRPDITSSSLERSILVPQQFDARGGERCFAAVAYPDPKSIHDSSQPRKTDSNPNSSGSEDRTKTASGSADVSASRKAPIPARRNPRRPERRSGSECLAFGSTLGTTDLGEKNVSEFLDPPREEGALTRPKRPPRASPDPPPREPSVGRVRGLSAMFEQQSMDRTDPSGRREQPQRVLHPTGATQDFSGRGSQEWRARSGPNGDGEMGANPAALRNLTIKL